MKIWTRFKYRFQTALLCAVFLLTQPFELSAFSKKYIQFSSKDLSQIKNFEKKTKLNEEGWYEVDSNFFNVKTKVDHEYTAKCAYFMDQLYVGLSKKFTSKIIVEEKPKVIIAADQQDYKTVLESQTESRGYFRYRYRVSAGDQITWTKLHLYSYTKGEQSFEYFYTPILKHEGTHMMLRLQMGTKKIPKFINEGFANYFQFWDFKKNSKTERKKQSTFLKFAREAYKKKEIPPLRELLYINQWDADEYGEITKMRYGLAECFASYLLETTDGQKIMKQIFDDIENQRAVLSKLKDREFETLEKAWLNYIKKI